jgi:hypothetical protein
MTEPTDDDVRDMLLDAEIHVIAQEIQSIIPQWYRDLHERHHAEAERMRAAGEIQAAEVFDKHGPCLDDGVACAASDSGYPCGQIRAFVGSAHVWTPMTDKWESGWEAEFDEYDSCAAAPSQQEGEDG